MQKPKNNLKIKIQKQFKNPKIQKQFKNQAKNP